MGTTLLNTVSQGIALTQANNGVEVLGTLSALKDGSGVARSELNGKAVVALSGDVGGIMADLTSLGGFTVSSVGQNAIKFGGVVGATIVLVCDTKQLYDRVASLNEITEKLKKAPIDSLEYQILKAEQIHMVKLIASSSSAVSVDTIEVALSAGAPIPSLPINAVAFAVSMGRIAYEKQTIESLKDSLIKSTKDWADKNSKLIKHKQSFINKHKDLELRYNQAKAEKDKTAAALEKASRAMRTLPHKGSIELHKKAQELDVEAEKTLNEIETQFQKSSRTLADLHTYEKASKQILELDPLLMKETTLVTKIETFLEHTPEVYAKSIPTIKTELDQHLSKSYSELHRYRIMYNPFPVLHHDERTRSMNNDIDKLHRKKEDLNKHEKNLIELSKVQKKRTKEKHKKLKEKPLSPEHFETDKHHATKMRQASTTVFHSPTPVPTLHHSFTENDFATKTPLIGTRGTTVIHSSSNQSMSFLERSTSIPH